MSKSKFSGLRKKLPFQYSNLIAQKLDGISPRQVLLVFRGEITDIEKVRKVLLVARELAAQVKKNKQLATIKTRRKKRSITKPTV